MKKLLILFALAIPCCFAVNAQILKKLGDKIKDKKNQRVDQKTDQIIDKRLDKTDDATKKDNDNNNSQDSQKHSSSTNTASSDASTAPVSLKAYSNYDFVPGDTVLFEDHFTDDQDGEFPAHW